MDSFLRLGADRQHVLNATFDHVREVWAGFDKAREGEPEMTDETVALLAEVLPELGSKHTTAPPLVVGAISSSVSAADDCVSLQT
jgi:hypothetical protein